MLHAAHFSIGCAVVLAVFACSGEDFVASGSGGASGAGAAGAGGTSTGGSAGATGGAAGTSGGTGGAAGAIGTGGSGGVVSFTWPNCGKVDGQPLLLYSTLNDLAAITTPLVGTGPGNAVPQNDFHSGNCETGILIDQANEHVELPSSTNIDYQKGTIDFWYLPKAAETDNAIHNLFATSGFFQSGEGGIKIRKSDSSNLHEFTVYIKDPTDLVHKTSVPETAYSFTPNTAIRITVAWNLVDTPGAPAVRIFFDKKEPLTYGARALLPILSPLGNAGGQIHIGAEKAADATPANGLIDDFKIYGASLAPK